MCFACSANLLFIQTVFMHISHDVMNSQPPAVPALGTPDSGFLIYCCKSNESQNSLATLWLFPLDWHLWQDRKPSPDADVISLIESVQDTMPALFQHIFGSDFTLFSSIVIRPSRSQQSHKVVLCSCNVGAWNSVQKRGHTATH